MRRSLKKMIFLIFIVFLIFTSNSVKADEIPFSLQGDFKIKYIYDNSIEKYLDQEKLNIEIEKDYSYYGSFNINMLFKSYSDYFEDNKRRETELSLSEAYIDYYTKYIDWRVGRQIIDWGSSYNIKPNNFFNPVDLSAINPLEAREDIDGLKAKYYYKNDQEVTAVIVLRDEVNPLQKALKYTKRRWNGFDFSASVFSGNQLEAVLMNKNIIYPEVDKIAFDLRGDITKAEVGVFSELLYNDFKDKIFEDGIELVFGFDYKFKNNLYLLSQYYYQNSILSSKDNRVFSLHADQPFRQFHKWELNMFYDLNTDLVIFRPKFIYSIKEGMELEIAAVIKINEDKYSKLNRINKETIYCGINAYF